MIQARYGNLVAPDFCKSFIPRTTVKIRNEVGTNY